MTENRKSSSDISQEIKAYWQKCEEELERAANNPHLMKLVNRKIAQQMTHLIASESHSERLTVLRHQPGVHSIIKELLSGISAQSSHTASRLRPKVRPTIRSLTVAAMQAARAQGRSLNEFIEGANERSARGISIQASRPAGTVKLKISVDKEPGELAKESGRDDTGDADGNPFIFRSRKALESWWQEAAKKK